MELKNILIEIDTKNSKKKFPKDVSIFVVQYVPTFRSRILRNYHNNGAVRRYGSYVVILPQEHHHESYSHVINVSQI